MNTISIQNQSCPNAMCPQACVVVHSQKKKRFKCTMCNKTWVAHKNGIYFGLRSEPQVIQRGVQLMEHGISIRKAAQYLNISPSTIQRWKERLAHRENLTQSEIY
ncbi:MAG: helix-turn-helix domain-containing protein [Candidatus Gracilibacteria bacterium]